MDLAQASFFRDCRKDYKRAFQIVKISVRSMAEDSDLWEKVDEQPESDEARRVNLAIWRFVKSQVRSPSSEPKGERMDFATSPEPWKADNRAWHQGCA